MAEVLRVLINGSFNLGVDFAQAGKVSVNKLVNKIKKKDDNEKIEKFNNPALPLLELILGVIFVACIVLILLATPIIYGSYLAFKCNKDLVQALLEFLIMLVSAYFYIGPLIYCFYKSFTCNTKGVKKLSIK
tara:strand:+ start:62 stop:457 length:396 start_codon:yes stop_codon:yes gene_type:complete